jgi:hypothetical protein
MVPYHRAMGNTSARRVTGLLPAGGSGRRLGRYGFTK